jgi:hypothetical protein
MKTTLTVDIDYDPHVTDPEAVASAMDILLATALSTPDILDVCGNPSVGEFLVADPLPIDGQLYALRIDADLLRRQKSLLATLVDSALRGALNLGQPQAADLLDGVLSLLDEIADQSDERRSATAQPEANDESGLRRRWLLYDLDTDALLSTQLYTSYEDAAGDAAQVNDVLVLPLICRGAAICPANRRASDETQEPHHGQPRPPDV